MLGQLGWQNTRGGRRKYGRYMESRVLELTTKAGSKELDEEWKRLRRGWCFWGSEFRDDLLERIVDVGLGVLGLTEEDVQALRKLDVRKQVLACMVRRRTIMGNEWVSRRLRMGDASNVSRRVGALAAYRDRRIRRMLKQVASAVTPKAKD